VGISRIGGNPVPVPAGVKVDVNDARVKVSSSDGKKTLEQDYRMVKITIADNLVTLVPTDDSKQAKAYHGLYRSLIANMIEGVSKGYERRLAIQGIGFKAELKGKNLKLTVGYTHPVDYACPQGVDLEVPAPTQIVVKGISKQQVGEVAAQIRRIKPPEPYKGKGIRYSDEIVKKKVVRA
jgi:large subunit ribosomal protein L6